MKSNRHGSRRGLLVGLLVGASLGSVEAMVVEFNGNNPGAFEQAVRDAGPGGTVNLRSNFVANRAIVINTPGVTINGNGNAITESSARRGVIIVNSANVTIRNLVINNNANRSPFRQGVTPGSSNTQIRACIFRNGPVGVRRFGDSPVGLVVANCRFNSTYTGLAYNRDIARILPNAGQQARLNRARNAGRLSITNNTIFGAHKVGITIDCGNDGLPGQVNDFNKNPGLRTGAVQPDIPIRRPASSLISRFTNGNRFIDRSLISGNSCFGSTKFGIAIARSEGFIVRNNTLSTSGNGFRRAIHFENRTRLVYTDNNTITVNAGGTGIGFAAFSDYGNPNNAAFGNRFITVDNNTVTGGGISIGGFGFANINIKNNNVNTTGETYRFFNIAGGVNQFTAVNNRRFGVVRNPNRRPNGSYN